MSVLLKERVETSPPPILLSSPVAADTHSHGRRNTIIDVLRGYCILMMITSHTGTATYINNGVHMLRFVSGAEGFVFLSGLVLGMVYRRKLDSAPPTQAYGSIWRRAGMIWLVHCLLVLLAVGANTWLFRYPDIPDVRQIGVPRLLWLTATLRFQPGHMLNILPLYVFLLGAAPFALELLRRGAAVPLLAGSFGVLLYCQYVPGAGRWVDPLCGGEAFPPLAWQGLFLPGLCVGFHYTWLRATLVGPFRRTLSWGCAIACAIMMVTVVVQTPSFQFYNHEAWDLFLWERHPLRLGRVVYFLVSVSAFYLMAHAWWHRSRLPRFPLRFLATLGRNSLYAFLVHLVFAFVLGVFAIPPDRWLLLELVPITTVAAVYLMARYQIGRRWIPN